MRLEYFLMVDRVVAFDGETIAAESTVPDASPVFEGHFPGHPLVPGVLLVETMAQAAGWLVLGRNGLTAMPFLASVKEAKFRRFVGPGARLAITARLTHDGSGYAVAATRIESGGQRLCDAEIMLRISPFPAPELEAAMRQRAAQIGLPGVVGLAGPSDLLGQAGQSAAATPPVAAGPTAPASAPEPAAVAAAGASARPAPAADGALEGLA
ncbi:3-hydroxyacyl-ACP dehydratase FabZ family protein [Roseomonas sp. BN140053]|uniref:3-hydroxyacyl-ACP dehydratase FabZ family protein n=1 Tax=Roseomonas sp. BN140053 TaxID=3391898 RepID=UPI0039EC0433